MRFYNQPHAFYCGVDLHARTMYLCILDQAGRIVLHQEGNGLTGPTGGMSPNFAFVEVESPLAPPFPHPNPLPPKALVSTHLIRC